MYHITLKPLLHRGQERVAIVCESEAGINGQLKKLPGIRWSQTQQCWHVPQTNEACQQLQQLLAQKAIINSEALNGYLQKRKALLASKAMPAPATVVNARQAAIIQNVSAGNMQQLQLLTQALTLKAYSASTINTYRNEFLQLLQTIKSKAVETLTVAQLKRYMVYCMQQLGISENTAHSRLNALKFYYEQVLGHEKFFWDMPRPKKRQLLPKVFSQDEIAAIIKAVKNNQHKVMLMLA